MRRILGAVSGHGRFRYTDEQVWYLSHLYPRRPKPEPPGPPGPWYARRQSKDALQGAGIAAALLAVGHVFDVGVLLVLAALFGIGSVIVLFEDRPHVTYRNAPRPMLTIEGFRHTVIRPWTAVYGEPPGRIRPGGSTVDTARPLLTIVTTSASVRRCLDENGVTERLSLAFAPSTQAALTGVPSAVLHDIGAAAFREAAATPVDITPTPAVALAASWSVWFRDRPPSSRERRRLRRGDHVSAADAAVLNDGWWSPLDGIPPGPLIALVTGAWKRLADPDARAAAEFGFMSWPTTE